MDDIFIFRPFQSKNYLRNVSEESQIKGFLAG